MYRLNKEELAYRERMRGKYSPDPKWYAIMAHCGRERHVRDKILFDLHGDGVEEVLLPEIKRDESRNGRQGSELLFPAYVFLRCRMNDATYMTISAYDTVLSVIGRAFRIPSVIDDTEMRHLKGVLATLPSPNMAARLNIGDWAEVTNGLMEGLPGRVVELNSQYARLETAFSFFDNGTGVLVSVPLTDLKAVERAGARLVGAL